MGFMLIQKLFNYAGLKSYDIVSEFYNRGFDISQIPQNDFENSISSNDFIGCFRDAPQYFGDMDWDGAKFIFLMRDPRECVISWFHAQHLHKDAPVPEIIYEDFEDYLTNGDRLIEHLDKIHHFLDARDHLILHYEDLVYNPVSFLQAVLKYADLDVPRMALDETLTSANCVQIQLQNNLHNRSGIPGAALKYLPVWASDILNLRYTRYIEFETNVSNSDELAVEGKNAYRAEIDSLKRYILGLAQQNSARIQEIEILRREILEIQSRIN